MLQQRIKTVLAGRQPYPWGTALGMNKHTINRLVNHGVAPSGKFLGRIARAERASLTWLLEGLGAPFIVSRPGDEVAAADYLRIFFEEPGWRVTIIRGGEAFALALTQPGRLEEGDWRLDYRITEVVAGLLGPQALAVLAAHPGPFATLDVPAATFARLESGWLGNPELFAMLDRAHPLDEVAEAAVGYNAGLPPDELALLDDYRALATADRDLVVRILARLTPAKPE